MRYGLFVSGRLIKLARTLREALSLRSYDPFNHACEVFEFEYVNGNPVNATLIK